MTVYSKPQLLPYVWAETGDKVQPTDNEISAGWPSSSVPPSRQRFNFAFNWAWQGVRYVMQRGLIDWDANEDYPAGAYVRGPNGKTYRAKSANTNKSPSSNPSIWERWGYSLAEFYEEQTLLAPKDDPVFTTNARGVTRPEGDSTTSFATTEFVMRAVANALTALIPVGLIAIWNGTADTIPPKWAICNGQNGTPDFRDRFIVGAGGMYAVNATGGQNTVVLSVENMPAHTHSGTTSAVGDHVHGAWTDAQGYHSHQGGTTVAGGHNHAYTRSPQATNPDQQGAASGASFLDLTQFTTDWTSWNGDHSHGIYGDGQHGHNIGMNGAGAHNHSFTTSAAGSSTAHENRPPFYAKLFIMRVAV